ncbi:hypothetical protein FPV67DRAFT_624524 [Lyophyllum atratum]|nr:hypothetical protein FPV67DRAFT_624524 [Lyophyllum atratum]
MFGTYTLTALLASATLLVVRADVVPTVPGPGTVYKEGGTCHTEWDGDAGSPTAWKNMAIELMTGDNFNMKHLTTVATGLDGTVAGSFDHPCPAVIPNSAIYFYQYSAPGAATKQWATRFAIASPSGATTPPANALQPSTNAPIAWGVGALANPSTAVPAPSGAGATNPPPAANGTTSSMPGPQGPNTFLSTSTNTVTSGFTTAISTSSTARPSSTATTNSTSGASADTKDNAAVHIVVESRVWQAAVALGACAVAFAALL